MKKSHIFVMAIIAVAAAIILSTTADASVYVGFGEARQRAASGARFFFPITKVFPNYFLVTPEPECLPYRH